MTLVRMLIQKPRFILIFISTYNELSKGFKYFIKEFIYGRVMKDKEIVSLTGFQNEELQ